MRKPLARTIVASSGSGYMGKGKLKYSAKPEFGAIVQKHKAFHAEAGKIARLINSNQYEQAEKEMGTGTPYSQASSAVGAAIIAFKRHL